MTFSLPTARLVLREWRDDDLPAYAALNADPAVREFFPGTLTAAQSDAQANYIRRETAQCGFGFWAVELPGIAPFIGFTGLEVPSYTAHFTPCVEIGWRFAAAYWGYGYATEAASAALTYGFSTLGLKEIVACTAVDNWRSRRVMERIGMTHDSADDFGHPQIAKDTRLHRHVLYRRAASV